MLLFGNSVSDLGTLLTVSFCNSVSIRNFVSNLCTLLIVSFSNLPSDLCLLLTVLVIQYHLLTQDRIHVLCLHVYFSNWVSYYITLTLDFGSFISDFFIFRFSTTACFEFFPCQFWIYDYTFLYWFTLIDSFSCVSNRYQSHTQYYVLTHNVQNHLLNSWDIFKFHKYYFQHFICSLLKLFIIFSQSDWFPFKNLSKKTPQFSVITRILRYFNIVQELSS